jgi:hypothetical protein
MKKADSIFKAFFGGDGDTLRRSPRDLEHRLQCACVRWFRLAYPQHHHNLFAVPNGGYRTPSTAAKIKAEGALPGVSDLILLIARGGYHGLLVELKTDKGRQSEAQREWQRLIEADGYKYVVVRSIEEFIKVVEAYLNETRNGK